MADVNPLTYQLWGAVKVEPRKTKHPHEKPTLYYKWLLEHYADPNMRVLDTHLGSGSSAIAAHYFGCDFVGCEIDKDYYEASLLRLESETSQMTLAIGT